jgi:hypothetical protein
MLIPHQDGGFVFITDCLERHTSWKGYHQEERSSFHSDFWKMIIAFEVGKGGILKEVNVHLDNVSF